MAETEKRVTHKTTQGKKQAALQVFATNGNISETVRIVGVTRRTWYDWIEADPEFAAAAKIAEEEATEYLENEAWKRATRAEDPSDTLLIFLLKGRKPHKYRDNARGDTYIAQNMQLVRYVEREDA